MSSENGKETPKVFDVNEINYVDTSEMEVMVGGVKAGWTWTFAGPSHPMGVAQINRIAAENLQRTKLQEQAQINGKKWKAPDRSPQEVIDENADYVLERLLGWSDVLMGGEPFPYSRENARKILTDRNKGSLLQQAIEHLNDDANFTRRSPKTSGGSRSAPST